MKGKELKEAIKKLGMSQRQFAKFMDRNEATVSLWCSDKEPILAYVVNYIESATKLKAARAAVV